MLIAIIVLLALILLTFIFILMGIMLTRKDGQKDEEEYIRVLGECLKNIIKQVEEIHDINLHTCNILQHYIDEKKNKKSTAKKTESKD